MAAAAAARSSRRSGSRSLHNVTLCNFSGPGQEQCESVGVRDAQWGRNSEMRSMDAERGVWCLSQRQRAWRVQQCSSAAVRRRRSRAAIPPAGVGARRRRCQGCGGGWLARKQRATALQPPSVPPARIELPRGSWSQSAPEARLSRLLECPIQAYCHASAASSREPPGQSIFLRWRSPTAKTPRIDSIVPTAHLTSAARLTLKKWLCTTTADYSVTPSST